MSKPLPTGIILGRCRPSPRKQWGPHRKCVGPEGPCPQRVPGWLCPPLPIHRHPRDEHALASQRRTPGQDKPACPRPEGDCHSRRKLGSSRGPWVQDIMGKPRTGQGVRAPQAIEGHDVLAGLGPQVPTVGFWVRVWFASGRLSHCSQ